MSLISQAGTAVQSASGKATENPLGQAIDDIAGGLAGQAGSAPAGTPRFKAGEPLETAADASSFPLQAITQGMPPPRSALALQVDKPLQFLHLCHAHDGQAQRFAGGPTSQGVAMRDALVREAVLLHAFAQGTQRVLAVAQAAKGSAGALLETAGALAGGQAQASPGPEAVDPILARIRAAVDPVNQAAFDYPTLHEAGRQLAQAADAHHAFCKQALEPGSGGGAGLPSVPGLSAALGGAGIPDIVGKIPQWLFKVQDAYLAMYAAARDAYEWPLMQCCHDYSLQAIRARWQPGYDIWRLRHREATEAAQADQPSLAEQCLDGAVRALESEPVTLGGQGHGATDHAAGRDVRDKLADARDAIAGVRAGAQDKAEWLAGLLATADDAQAGMPAEAVAALEAACKVLAGDPARGIPPLGRLMADAVGRALAQGGLPPFFSRWSGLLADAAIHTLDAVLRRIHASRGGPDPALVLAAVHHALASRLTGLVFELVFGRPPAANDTGAQRRDARDAVGALGAGDPRAALDKASGLVPGKDQLADKGADLLRAGLASQARHLDGIVLFVASELTQELVGAWMAAHARQAMTMEAYLGRLPMLAATLMRNLMFPIFNLVMHVFGLGDKLAGAVWDPVGKAVGHAADAANAARDAKQRVAQTGDDVRAGAERVDDKLLGDGDDSLKQRVGDRLQDLSHANQNDAAGGFRRQGGTLAGLGDDVRGAPGELTDAARGDPASTAIGDPAAQAPAGSGPLSAARIADGRAQAVTLAQLNQAGRETAMAEKDFLRARRPA